MLSARNSNPRLLIAKLRDGDYAHAGEQEAIDLVLGGIDQLTKKKINGDGCDKKLKAIDIGCGLGGTANYIKNTRNFDVFGIDIDMQSIQYAKDKYRNLSFFHCDVTSVNSIFPKATFDLVYMFNVFYAFNNQVKALKALAEITNSSGLLVIFDYTYQGNQKSQLTDLADNPMYPIVIQELKVALDETGWELLKIVDLREKYFEWYSNFLTRLHDNKIKLLAEFSEEACAKVEKTFLSLLNSISCNILSGSIIYARLK